MPGPPPKPTEVKRRNGNPGKRPLPSALRVVPAASPESRTPPAGLGAAGIAAWNRAIALPWAADSDLETARHWARDEDLAAEQRALIAEMGHILYTDKGYAYQNPALGALNSTTDRISRWMRALGLDPASRAALGVEVVRARNALEEMMERRRG